MSTVTTLLELNVKVLIIREAVSNHRLVVKRETVHRSSRETFKNDADDLSVALSGSKENSGSKSTSKGGSVGYGGFGASAMYNNDVSEASKTALAGEFRKAWESTRKVCESNEASETLETIEETTYHPETTQIFAVITTTIHYGDAVSVVRVKEHLDVDNPSIAMDEERYEKRAWEKIIGVEVPTVPGGHTVTLPVVKNEEEAKETKVGSSLLVIGGADGSSLNTVELHNEAVGSFFLLTGSMQEKRMGPCAAVIHGQVYVAGGHNGASYLGSVERYNPEGGKWTTLRGAMKRPRRYCAAAAVDGRLYVMGGYDGKNRLNSVEMYDTRTDSWSSTVASMGSKRSGCAAVSLGGKVYVLGGFDGSSRLNSGEVYDPKKNEWTSLPANMNSKRHCCAAAVFGDKIYVAGGYDDSSTLNSVEVYDPGAGTWSYLSARMHTKRSECAAAVIGGKLFVAGGWGLDSVEVYDPTTERWTVMTMGSKRRGCAAVVV